MVNLPSPVKRSPHQGAQKEQSCTPGNIPRRFNARRCINDDGSDDDDCGKGHRNDPRTTEVPLGLSGLTVAIFHFFEGTIVSSRYRFLFGGHHEGCAARIPPPYVSATIKPPPRSMNSTEQFCVSSACTAVATAGSNVKPRTPASNAAAVHFVSHPSYGLWSIWHACR